MAAKRSLHSAQMTTDVGFREDRLKPRGCSTDGAEVDLSFPAILTFSLLATALVLLGCRLILRRRNGPGSLPESIIEQRRHLLEKLDRLHKEHTFDAICPRDWVDDQEPLVVAAAFLLSAEAEPSVIRSAMALELQDQLVRRRLVRRLFSAGICTFPIFAGLGVMFIGSTFSSFAAPIDGSGAIRVAAITAMGIYLAAAGLLARSWSIQHAAGDAELIDRANIIISACEDIVLGAKREDMHAHLGGYFPRPAQSAQHDFSIRRAA